MSRISALLGALALSGCIGHMSALEKNAPDWPKLAITEHYSMWETTKNCNGLFNIILGLPAIGCVRVDLNKMTCDAYYMFKWVRQGEIDHCEGGDHAGTGALAEGWQDYKSGMTAVAFDRW